MIEKIKYLYGLLKKKWDENPSFGFVVFFCLMFAMFSFTYLPQSSSSQMDDHFFHFKFAYLLRTEGVDAAKNFDWIKLTELAEKKGNFPIALYYIAIMPFTYIDDLILGMKLSDIFMGALSLSLLYYVFRKNKISHLFFFVLILLSSGYFFQRMLLGRAFVLTIALIFLEMHLVVKGKYKKFFLVSIFHTLWHSSTFFFPFIVAIIVESGRYLQTKKFQLKNILTSAGGSFLGLVLLWRLDFFYIIGLHLKSLFSAQLAALNTISQGVELRTKDPMTIFWGSSEIFFLLAILAIGATIYLYYSWVKELQTMKNIEESQKYILMYSAFIFLIVSILGSMVVSGRFYDFYYPALVFLAGISLSIIIKDKKILIEKRLFKFLAGSLLIYLLFLTGNNLVNRKIDYASKDHTHIEKTARWVESESDDKELIFLQNWSYFPMLFFYNNKNNYTMGLDPMTLYGYSHELYWKWNNIFLYNIYCEEQRDCVEEAKIFNEKLSKAEEDQKKEMLQENGKEIIQSIKNDFGSKFVISNSSRFNQALTENNELIEKTFEAKSDISGEVFKAFKLK